MGKGSLLPALKGFSAMLSAPETKPLALALESEVSVESCPVLESHVLDGKAVLPAALAIEWLSHGAMHGNPGLRFLGFDDFRVFKGVVLGAEDSRTVQVCAGKAEKRDGAFVVPTELRSIDKRGRPVLHAAAQVRLGSRLEEAGETVAEPDLRPWPSEKEYYGAGLLFHGPDFQGILTVEGCGEEGIVARIKAAPKPAAWLRRPLRSSWITDPLAVDGAFQMLILWSSENHGTHSLPVLVRRYRQFRQSFPEGGVRVVVRIRSRAEHKAESDIDFLDPETGELVARIEGYDCVMDTSLTSAFERNRLVLQS